MKRYDLAAECSKCGSITKDLTASPIGDWVSYEDMLGAMNWLIDELWSDLHEVDREHLIKEAMEQ